MEAADCEVCSTSPLWSTGAFFNWYKNFRDTKTHHQRFLESWWQMLPYILTGLPVYTNQPADQAMAKVVLDFMQTMSAFSDAKTEPDIHSLQFPTALKEYFVSSGDSRLLQFSAEVAGLFDKLNTTSVDEMLTAYLGAKWLRQLWGTPYHYLSFRKAELLHI